MTDFGNGGARASRETLFGRHIKPSIHITTMIHDAPLEMLLFFAASTYAEKACFD